MKNILTLIFLFFTIFSFSQTYQKGDKVQIEWKGQWYSGKIESVSGEKYTISYDGYDASWNETVGKERLKTATTSNSTTNNTNSNASSTNNGNLTYASYKSVETIWDLAMSPDGKYILAASAYGKLVIINAETMEEAGHIKLTSGSPIFTAAWSPDGDFIATGYNDGNGIVYQRTEGMQFTEYDTLEGYSSVFKMRFSPKSNSLLLSGAPKEDYIKTQVDIWDINQKRLKKHVIQSTNSEKSISDIEWSNEGDKIAIGISNKKKGIEIYDSAGTFLKRLENKFDVSTVKFASAGLLLASGGIDGNITLWNLADGKTVWVKPWRTKNIEYVNDIAFSPNSLNIAVVGRGSGSSIKIYNMINGDVKTEFGTANPVGNSILFGSDSKTVYAAFTTYGDISKVPVVCRYSITE